MAFPDILHHLQQHFELISVCPEVEIGLAVPRPPVQLTGSIEHPAMTGRDNPELDVSLPMQRYCSSKPEQLRSIAAYIFKSRSPSCGLWDVPIFRNGSIIESHSQGLFARAICTRFPQLPVCDETELADKQQRVDFIQRVMDYYKNRLDN
jgi:uncharacterized protein YbbK (DUF523 family)